ncbi:MAG: hypothetical protein AB1604_08060 [Euryarchaeota archaeon]
MSFTNPNVKISPWKKKLLIIMRISLLLLGSSIIIFGSGGTKVFGLMTLLALGVIYLPTLFNRKHLQIIPVEVEILFLVVVILEYILGNTFGLYGRIDNYDKFMHFTIPMIVALSGMMFMYTAYLYGRIRTSYWIMAFLIVMVTLGIGALLELVEYFYDNFLYLHISHVFPTGLTQGSPTMDPLTDTMYDLFTDLIGGIAGALLGVVLIKRAEKKGKCVDWVDGIAHFEGLKNEDEANNEKSLPDNEKSCKLEETKK